MLFQITVYASIYIQEDMRALACHTVYNTSACSSELKGTQYLQAFVVFVNIGCVSHNASAQELSISVNAVSDSIDVV